MLPVSLLLDGRKVTADVADAHKGSTETWSMDAADTFTVDVDDTDRALLRSKVFRQRSRLQLDGLVYELRGVSKSGDSVSLRFEDADVAVLRRKSGVLTVAGLTRTQFAERLARQAPGVEFRGEPGSLRKLRQTQGTTDDADENAWDTLKGLASTRQWRCFLHRHVLWFGSDAWLRKQRDVVTLSESTPGVEGIDFSYDTNVRDWRDPVGSFAADATVVAHARRWSLPPGTPVLLDDGWVSDGPWLVAERTRAPYDDLTTLTLTQRQPSLPEPDPAELVGGAGDYTAGGSPVIPGAVSSRGYMWPIAAPVISVWGDCRRVGSNPCGRLHKGIDIGEWGATGRPVVASKAGVASNLNNPGGYGLYVSVRHSDGSETRYAHLSRYSVTSGSTVAQGQQIGACGTTGNAAGGVPHVHFEILIGGSHVDPLPYMPGR